MLMPLSNNPRDALIIIPRLASGSVRSVAYSVFGASEARTRPLTISPPREKIMYVDPTSQAPLQNDN